MICQFGAIGHEAYQWIIPFLVGAKGSSNDDLGRPSKLGDTRDKDDQIDAPAWAWSQLSELSSQDSDWRKDGSDLWFRPGGWNLVEAMPGA